ncbi:unnamed protein product [Phytophthora fragariaefolia]|uniref:Unnamed protein product n=1 Tax=Phytophthora fragariaefolia TaxID=1490495 RepID=A0A9W6Y737_9STRA|nr:unnamed protein product [Phytophthora fragariaefolia]
MQCGHHSYVLWTGVPSRARGPNPLSNARGEAASLRAADGGMDRSPEHGVARNPLGDARGEAASMHAHDGMVRSEPRHQVCGPNGACGVAQNPLSDARMDDEPSLDAKACMVCATPKPQGRSPAVECGVAHNPLSGSGGQNSTSLSVGRDTEAPSELEEVMTPECATGASTTATRRRTTSAKRRRRRKMLAARRMASGMSRDVNGLDAMSFDEFGEALQAGELAEVVVIRPEEELNSSSPFDEAVLEDAKKALNARSISEILKNPSDPFYPVIREYEDMVSKEPPSGFPPDRGVRHVSQDSAPYRGNGVTALTHSSVPSTEAGLVRESKSQHSTPTFCVRTPNGKWRILHAFNKLNAATIPAQTSIPRKDVLQNNMVGCTLYSALDFVDGYYLLLMRANDIPLTAVSTPSDMLWERIVMPQELSNAPATFNRLATQLFRPHRAYAQAHFYDILVHSRAELGKPDVENHVEHLRAVLECTRTNKLYANIDKCIFGAEEIPFLGRFIGERGLRADPAKVKAIVEWSVPRNQKDLRKWLGFANYLHKYSENYADMARPLSNFIKKNVECRWNAEHQDAFETIKERLLHAPILALPDPDRPFNVVCDASDFAIGCALLQKDAEGRERVIAFESRQLKAAEKNYPVHDKELLVMKYALVKFRVHLLGSKPFVIYTDRASLRTATQSPHLSQRMARWLSFFAEYNFEVKYKPGKQNDLADALSRRPDYELAHVTAVMSSIPNLIRASYASDDMSVALLKALGSKEFEDSDKGLSARLRARLHRYAFDGGLLYYSTGSDDPPRVVVSHDEDLKYRILYEAHDTPVGETCQQVKSAPHAGVPLASLPVPSGCWQSISMDFVFGLPPDATGNTGVVVFVDRLSKMAHLAAVPNTIDGEGTAMMFLDRVFRQHGLPEAVVSDRDPRFTGKFWTSIFAVLGTRLECPPRIIRRPTVRRNASTALSSMSSAAFVLKRLSVGASYSHSLSLRSTTLCMPQPATRRSM